MTWLDEYQHCHNIGSIRRSLAFYFILSLSLRVRGYAHSQKRRNWGPCRDLNQRFTVPIAMNEFYLLTCALRSIPVQSHSCQPTSWRLVGTPRFWEYSSTCLRWASNLATSTNRPTRCLYDIRGCWTSFDSVRRARPAPRSPSNSAAQRRPRTTSSNCRTTMAFLGANLRRKLSNWTTERLERRCGQFTTAPVVVSCYWCSF